MKRNDTDACPHVQAQEAHVALTTLHVLENTSIEVRRLLLGCASTISEGSPSHKTPSAILLLAHPEEAKDDEFYASRNFTMEDVLPDQRDLEVKPWSKGNERAGNSCIWRRGRLFPRAEFDLLAEMRVKDTLPECNIKQAFCTVQRAKHQTVAASRGNGHRQIYRSEEPITHGVEDGMSKNRQVVEHGGVASPKHSVGVSGWNPPIHLRDTLPCVLRMPNSIKAECNSDTCGVATRSSCLWRLHARSEEPITHGVEDGASKIHQVVERGGVASPKHSVGVLGWNPHIHLRDTLPCVLRMPNSIKAEGNSDASGVATRSSCLWRLHGSSIEVRRLLLGCASTISEGSPSHKTPSAILLLAHPEEAKGDEFYASRNFTMEDVLPDQRDLEVKPWSKGNERAGNSCIWRRGRLFPRAEFDLLAEMRVKDTLPECNIKQAFCTVQRAKHQTVAASRGNGHRQIYRSEEPVTHGVEDGMSKNRQVVEHGGVASPKHSVGVSGWNPPIHLRDTLPSVLRMPNSIKAEGNSDTCGVATRSSCRWRLHARFAQPRADGSSAAHASNGAQ
ncbi:uncharacterized protein LOC142569095 [Dermacentor variabilis]|uniref:uncharacterized protein LOC142569095 n=1 Tax=Dermacentor variabilis TaxID=34621 RepID=UPI003F5C394B